jgi:heat shock protein HslJ
MHSYRHVTEEAAMYRLLLLPLLIAALTGCPQRGAVTPDAAPGSPGTPAASGLDAQLARYHWRLRSATDASGKRIDALFVRDDAAVQLDFRNGRVGVSNTCNRIGGTYRIDGDALVVGNLASTMMACTDAGRMALDGEVSRRLEGPLAYTLAESEPPQLRLRNRAGDVLSFAAEPTAATRYGGAGGRLFLEVAAQTRPCPHPLIPDKQCLQVREVRYDAQGRKSGDTGGFEHFYDAIDGYTHEPGIRNVLRVDRYTVQDPPADASRHAYVLDMVVESERVAR